MKTIIKYIFIALSLLAFNSLSAQVNVERGAWPSEIQSCSLPIAMTYTITNNSNVNNITVSESFDLNGCLNPITSIQISNAPAGTTVATNPSGFSINVINPPNGSQTVITLNITFEANNIYQSVEICTNGVSVASSPSVSTSVNAPPGCIKVESLSTWQSEISCVSPRGLNCRRYTVRVFDVYCKSANIYGNPRFSFNAPAGAIITNITGNVSNITGIGSSNINFTSNTNTWLSLSTVQTFVIDVEYPCGIFQPGDSTDVTVFFSHISPGSNPVNYGVNCPGGTAGDGVVITGSNRSHTLKRAEIIDSLIISNCLPGNCLTGYDKSKNSPGCNSKLRLTYLNQGNTFIDNLDIVFPVPPQIELTKLCAPNNISGHRINNGPLINNAPTIAQLPNVTEIRLRKNPNILINPALECSTGGGPGNNGCHETGNNGVLYTITNFDICYRIKPNIQVGTNITFSATYISEDGVECEAPNCLPFVSEVNNGAAEPYVITVVTPEPKYALSKRMTGLNPLQGQVPTQFYPNQQVEILLYLGNSGSGNLQTTLTDVLNSEFENITINQIEYQADANDIVNGVWGPVPAGVVTNQTVTGNTVSIDVNIPGICELNATGCCGILFNAIRVRVLANVKACTPIKSATNTVNVHENFTGLFYSCFSKSVNYRIINHNQIQIAKEAKGNASNVFTNTVTQVTPGGDLDFKIQVRNDNPQPWTGLVLADILPHIGDTNLCNNSPRGSQFNTELRNPITVTFNNCPGITSHTITYTGITNSNILAVCGSGQPIGNGYTAADNKGFQIKFEGSVDCGCVIDIDVPAKVTTLSGLLGGETATNQVAFKTNENTVPAISSVKAEILAWQLDCCRDGDIKLENFQVLETVRESEHSRVAFNYQLSTNSNIPIKEVRMSIVDFDFVSNNSECEYCYNKSSGLGSFTGHSNWTWNLPQSNTGLIVQPQEHFPSWNGGREIIWGLGTPINLSTPVDLRSWFNIPLQRNLECCGGGVISVCFKIEVTDVNCKTCEVIQCVTFPWRN